MRIYQCGKGRDLGFGLDSELHHENWTGMVNRLLSREYLLTFVHSTLASLWIGSCLLLTLIRFSIKQHVHMLSVQMS